LDMMTGHGQRNDLHPLGRIAAPVVQPKDWAIGQVMT